MVDRGMVLLSMFFFYIAIACATKTRPTKCYIDVNGNLDLKTPRRYVAKKISSFRAILGSPWVFNPGMQIAYFYYADGCIVIITRANKRIECKLKNLEVIIVDRTKGMEHVVLILKAGGNKLKVTHNTFLFEDQEIEDINSILSNAAIVRETTLSKLNKHLEKAKDFMNDENISSAEGISAKAVKMLKQAATDRAKVNAGEILENSASFIEEELRKVEEMENPKTPFQIETDTKISQFLNENRKISQQNNILLSELILNSSDKGRRNLFLAYENQKESEFNCVAKDDFDVMKAIYPTECFLHFIDGINEDIGDLALIKYLLITACFSIPIFTFDNLGGWNILVGLGLLMLCFYIINKYLVRSSNLIKKVKDEISIDRKRIVQTKICRDNDNVYKYIKKTTTEWQQKYKTMKIQTWTWTFLAMIILTICLHVPFEDWIKS